MTWWWVIISAVGGGCLVTCSLAMAERFSLGVFADDFGGGLVIRWFVLGQENGCCAATIYVL